MKYQKDHFEDDGGLVTPLCTSDPGTGEIYHCSDINCPTHGERNREEAEHQVHMYNLEQQQLMGNETDDF